MRRRAPRTQAAAPNKAIPQAPTDASHLCAEGGQKRQTGHCPDGAPVGAGAEAGCRGLAKGWIMQHRASSGGGMHGPGSWLQSGGWAGGSGSSSRGHQDPQLVGGPSELEQILGVGVGATRPHDWGAMASRAQEQGFPGLGLRGQGRARIPEAVGPPMVWWGRARHRGQSMGHRRKRGWGLAVALGEGQGPRGRGWAGAHTSSSPVHQHLPGQRALGSCWRRLSPVLTGVLFLTCK